MADSGSTGPPSETPTPTASRIRKASPDAWIELPQRREQLATYAQGRRRRRPARRLGHERQLPDRLHRRRLDAPADPRPGDRHLRRPLHDPARAGMPRPGGPHPAGRPADDRRRSPRSVGKLGIRRLGVRVGGRHRSADFDDAAGRSCRTVELDAVEGRVEALRAIKDEEEIAAIREAIGYRRAGLRDAPGRARGRRDREGRGRRPRGYLRRCGATAASFPPIVAVGPRAALPHARPTADDADRRRPISCSIDWGATGRPVQK